MHNVYNKNKKTNLVFGDFLGHSLVLNLRHLMTSLKNMAGSAIVFETWTFF